MSRKARESAATKTLLQHVEKRTTGRLSVGVRSAEVSVWLLDGDIVAATSATDELSLVRLAGLASALDASAQTELQGRIASGGSVFGDLLERLPPALADRLLAQRFRANLLEYLGSLSRPAFTELRAVFVDNVQIGHDSAELVAACGAEADRAATLDLDAILTVGPTRPDDAFGTLLRERLAANAVAIGSLLADLPYEPVLTRAWIHAALDAGAVVVEGVALERDDWSEDDATEHDRSPLVLAHAEPARAGARVETPEIAEDPPTPDTADAANPLSRGLLGLAADDEVGVEDGDGPGLSPEGMESVRSWLSKAHAVEESELDFFEDHDTARRGGSEDGSFSTGQHNLEKVEVTLDAAGDDDGDEILEVDEAPAARFSAPTIGETEAANKVQVINTVLGTICAAFDRAEGPGRGRAAFQLLIEGSPPRYQAIFDGLQVSDEGTLPADEVVSNLLARPQTEQRLLLTQALSDLIERALSGAADELPDEEIDALLESTAGYRSRLGL